VGKEFGFRKCIAVEDAIFKVTNEISNPLHNKKKWLGAFLWSRESFQLCQS